jgi:hypothetical protein
MTKAAAAEAGKGGSTRGDCCCLPELKLLLRGLGDALPPPPPAVSAGGASRFLGDSCTPVKLLPLRGLGHALLVKEPPEGVTEGEACFCLGLGAPGHAFGRVKEQMLYAQQWVYSAASLFTGRQ